MRVYRYKGDILLRFCSEPYHPLDFEIVDKYVPTESYTPEIAIFKSSNYSAIDALNHHMRHHGHDVENLWDQVDDAIMSISLTKLAHINRYSLFLGSKKDTVQFELLRFDFIIDADTKVYLMEVNSNPMPSNSSEHSLMFEQMLHNTFATLGLTSRVEMKPKLVEQRKF